MFCNLFSPMAHPNLQRQVRAHHKMLPHKSTELCMSTNTMYLHASPFPTRMQAYEIKTLHTLDKTINDEPMCMCACTGARVHVCVTNSKHKRLDNAIF